MKEKIKKIIKKVVDKKIAKKAKAVKVVKTKNAIPFKSKKVFIKNKKITTSKILKTKKKILPKTTKKRKEKKVEKIFLHLKKTNKNPIIEPSSYSWETKATFNPAAFESNGTIHIVYRAIGNDNNSVLGYAYTFDGLNIGGRPTYHIYKRFLGRNENVPKIDYISGGGWSGGCEDPRITVIGDTIYMLYNAFDGWGSIRVALTSIKLDDFQKRKWNWEKSILISPVGERHKNWVLFPEKINGKYAILHNLHTDDLSRVMIEYFDNLKEEDFKNVHIESPDPNAMPSTLCAWHIRMRSVGPPPIKTRLGWLVLYHATDEKEPSKYKLGTMILDLKDPTKVLYRSRHPILEPEEDYENNGNKWGIVYSCGAVVKEGKLFVYYGGSDKYVCVASVKIEELLDSLEKDKEIKLKNKKEIK